MKQSIILVVAIVCFAFLACKKSASAGTVDASSNTSSIVQQGTWKVTLFNENGNDKTSLFSGYNFTFSSGAITATKASLNISGTYSNLMNDSQNKMIIDFGNSSPLDELNKDWHVSQQTDVKLQLEDVSGGNGGTDLLTFEKN
jgi:hypothetical protein